MSLPAEIRNASVGADASLVRATPSEHIDVRDHGAKLDGSHDDRDAVQSALDEAGEDDTADTVHVPSGTVRIGSQIRITDAHCGVTLCGDGPESHLRLDGGFDENQSVLKIYAGDDGTISRLTVRDLRIDGNGDEQVENNVRGITAIENGDGGTDNLVENVWFHDALANNCHWGLPDTTFRFVSSWGAHKWHGLGLDCQVDDRSRPLVVEHCHFRANGTHGINASEGHTRIRHVLSEENGWGGKNTGATFTSEWQDVVFRNNDHLGWMTSGAVRDTVTMDRVMSRGNGAPGFYVQGGGTLEVGEMVALENNQIEENSNGVGNIYVADGVAVRARSVKSGGCGRGPGLYLSSESTGTVETYVHDGGNASQPLRNDSSVNVASVTEGRIDPLPLPTNPRSIE